MCRDALRGLAPGGYPKRDFFEVLIFAGVICDVGGERKSRKGARVEPLKARRLAGCFVGVHVCGPEEREKKKQMGGQADFGD